MVYLPGKQESGARNTNLYILASRLVLDEHILSLSIPGSQNDIVPASLESSPGKLSVNAIYAEPENSYFQV